MFVPRDRQNPIRPRNIESRDACVSVKKVGSLLVPSMEAQRAAAAARGAI